MIGDGFVCDQDGYYIEVKAGTTVNYGFFWRDWLAGRAIQSSTWEVPSGLTKVSDGHDDISTSVTITANSPGTYVIGNTIQAEELAPKRTFRIIVEA
ncbi:hypothetical protein [Propionivibrio sp.]|uniref:phage fiber-tail adaptor protein n=1 Tax=Propionivibrio sp. TaxID=2212460 RepID=UPI0039E59945